MSGVQNIPVSEDDNDLRLDKWFKRHFPHLGHAHIQKIIRKGEVRVDGKRAKGETRLAAGQMVRVPPLPEAEKIQKRGLDKKDADFAKSLVLYKDDHVIVLNKPPGLPTQGGSGIRQSVDDLLEALKFGGQTPRLVHRLDKETSGALLLARTAQVAKKLGSMFQGRDVKKIYWAITAPPPRQERGEIRGALRRLPNPTGRQVALSEEEGKSAVTVFRVMERIGNKAALVAFMPMTGRTHQIRAHAELIGAPLLGDSRYGGGRLEGADVENTLHLHARRLILPHPSGKGMLDVTAPLSETLKKTWSYFGLNVNDTTDPFEDFEG